MTDLVTTISQPASLQLVITPPAEIKTTLQIGQGPAGIRGIQGEQGMPAKPNFLMVMVTADHIAAKAITLPSTPRFEAVVNIVGGTAQKQDIDFVIAEDILSWDSLALELLLEAGDYLSIFYV